MNILFYISFLISSQLLKTAFFTNAIMDNIRLKKSKTFIRKNSDKKFLKRYLFIGFKEYVPSPLYYGNIIYVAFMLLYSIVGLITLIIGNQSYISLVNLFVACIFFLTFIMFFIYTSKEKFEENNSMIYKFLFIIANTIVIILLFYGGYLLFSEFLTRLFNL